MFCHSLSRKNNPSREMKTNLKFYSHEVGSHNHWKFKLLRRKYTWAGEGKFWALNNLIADSEKCLLDLHDDDKVGEIAADLDFDIDEFNEFVGYLEKKCKLLKKVGGLYTTEMVQKNLTDLQKIREFDRHRKNGHS